MLMLVYKLNIETEILIVLILYFIQSLYRIASYDAKTAQGKS